MTNKPKLLIHVILCIITITFPILSFQYGISWDERLSIEYSQKVFNYFKTFGYDKECLDISIPVYNHLIYYGNFFGLLTTCIQKILPIDIVSIRHLTNSLFGAGTIWIIFGISKKFGNSLQTLLAVFLILFTPRFLGYSMNGFRDVTFMFGYTLCIYTTLSLIELYPRYRLKELSLLALGIFICSSIRIAGLITIPAILISLMFHIGLKRQLKFNKDNFKYVLAIIISIILAYVLIVAIWPWAHQNVLIHPVEALFKFSDINLIMSYQLYFGELIPNRNVPFSFLFVWYGITLPMVVLIGLFLFLIFFRRIPVFCIYILIFLILPLLLYTFSARNLYDSGRQFLFIVPPIVVLSSYGWIKFYNLMNHRYLKKGLLFAFGLLIALPLFSIIKLHPSQSSYFNELIGGLKGAYSRFEIEIDGNNARYAAEWLNNHLKENKEERSIIGSNLDGLSVSYFIEKNKIEKVEWLRHNHLYTKNWDYAVMSMRTLNKYQLRKTWPYEDAIFNYIVDGVPIISVLKNNNKNVLEGLNLAKMGRYTDAIQLFNQAILLNKNSAILYNYRGASYLKLNEVGLAKSDFEKALLLNSLNDETHYYMSELEYKNGNLGKANQHINKSTKIRIDNYEAFCLKAKINYLLYHHEDATSLLDSILALTDLNLVQRSTLFNGIGEIEMMKIQESKGKCKKCFNKAVDNFENAINHNKKNSIPYNNLVTLYESRGLVEEAKFVRRMYYEYNN